jgi:hypothetical protein
MDSKNSKPSVMETNGDMFRAKDQELARKDLTLKEFVWK